MPSTQACFDGDTSFRLVVGPARPRGESSSVKERRDAGRREEILDSRDPGVGSRGRYGGFSGVIGRSRSAEELVEWRLVR